MQTGKAIMPFDIERIVQVCKDSGLPITVRGTIGWKGPNRDVISYIHPLLVEPLEYYGGPKLKGLLVEHTLISVASRFYDIPTGMVDSIFYQLQGTRCRCDQCRIHKPIADELLNRLVQAAVL